MNAGKGCEWKLNEKQILLKREEGISKIQKEGHTAERKNRFELCIIPRWQKVVFTVDYSRIILSFKI
jgi:hypothetical protein